MRQLTERVGFDTATSRPVSVAAIPAPRLAAASAHEHRNDERAAKRRRSQGLLANGSFLSLGTCQFRLATPSKWRIMNHLPIRSMAQGEVGVHVDVLGKEMY